MTVLSDLKEYVATEWSQLFDSCNWIHPGRRSRRKAAADGKENALSKGSTKTGSLSQSSTRPGKSPSSDFSVCESIDDELLRRLSTIPPGMEPNEWMATHGKQQQCHFSITPPPPIRFVPLHRVPRVPLY
uniref:Uncharacterized protein n=1 Tax=Plectus sambesii TaxID=2011161 RepID=A0A914WTR0_9BILA